jgi:glycerate kinase
MRIVLAPDKFKACLSAPQVCEAMREGIVAVDPTIEIDRAPLLMEVKAQLVRSSQPLVGHSSHAASRVPCQK